MNHTNSKNLPKVAIIGRPNVGKSSLFNRILKRRKAIIESVAGVTRDRLYAQIKIESKSLILVDTGGIVSRPKEKIAQAVYRQSQEAINEADLILFICDATSGMTDQDDYIASLLKASKKKTFLLINKVDSSSKREFIFDFYKLGLGEPYEISVLHGRGFSQLYKDLAASLPATNNKEALKQEEITKIAIVGRPNVGKSSFINCILDEERLVVDEMPGTTRDSIDIFIKRERRGISIIDTAGIRHKKKIKDVVEIFSLARTKESIKRSDVAIIMIDATAFLYRDDISVIDYVIKNGKPCILIVNKWDLISDKDAKSYRRRLQDRLRMISWIPILFTSCKDKHNIIKAIDRACETAQRAKATIQTARINKLLERVQKEKPHPYSKRVRPKIFYATQISTAPPKFLLFCSKPGEIKREYLRFLERSFRMNFDLEGIPMVLELRKKE